MEELLEVVSSSNKPTGIKSPRSLVHENGNWHRTSHVWIINDRDEILCNKRSLRSAFPGKWDMIFGGHVKSGDSYKETAVKELSEELGLSVDKSSLKLLGNFKVETKVPGGANREFIRAYLLRTDASIKRMKIQRNEISEIRYFPRAEIEKLKKGKKFVPAWAYYSGVLKIINRVNLMPRA